MSSLYTTSPISLFALVMTGLATTSPARADDCSDATTVAEGLTCLNEQILALEARNTALEEELFEARLLAAYLRVGPGSDTVLLEGADLVVRSGSGSTDDGGALTGRGNVIVGYAALHGAPEDQVGSHNLVVGDSLAWRSHGGLVSGHRNTVEAPHATTLGGLDNEASGTAAAVGGGGNNLAAGWEASVMGGLNGASSDTASAVCGGESGIASYTHASVSGGSHLWAGYRAASATGGHESEATGATSAVLGGWGTEANAEASSVVGGTLSEVWPYAAGGTLVSGYETRVTGERAVAVGGWGNDAAGVATVTLSGGSNVASGSTSVVLGSVGLEASADHEVLP